MRDLNEQVPAPFTLHLGDCIEVMRKLPDNSVDAIVTDPPYELGFMSKSWDTSGIANNVHMWREALRVLKPGGHMLAFSGSRTYHRMATAIEDAGFEIRDQIMWVYGSGFPKSLNVGKALEKIPLEDSPEEVECWDDRERWLAQWEGWGTALKPAHEPIAVARKPLAKGLTVAANVLQFGTGAINIDGCRVGEESTRRAALKVMTSRGVPGGSFANQDHRYADRSSSYPTGSDAGRWPANMIHDGSAEVVALFPESTSGAMRAGTLRAAQDGPGSVCYGTYGGNATAVDIEASTGSAARFFYCAKASRADRNEGLASAGAPAVSKDATMRECEIADWSTRNGNHHPTVKPTDLMAYLVRLVTPPGGLVLDPFMGSGSTGKACMREGFRFVGIDMTPEYVEIARARIEHEQRAVAAVAEQAAIPEPQLSLFGEVA